MDVVALEYKITREKNYIYFFFTFYILSIYYIYYIYYVYYIYFVKRSCCFIRFCYNGNNFSPIIVNIFLYIYILQMYYEYFFNPKLNVFLFLFFLL